ncbi:MAG: hypothetical protein HKO76_11530 [Acidimicrobiia bacterium]|nr:hypothetical protein [Acidimicrobiia bacterium]
MMKRSPRRLPGKHRKCLVPECHLPSDQNHCDGDPHNCGKQPYEIYQGVFASQPAVTVSQLWNTTGTATATTTPLSLAAFQEALISAAYRHPPD